MKWLVALMAATVLFGTSVDAQNSRVQELDAKNGQPIAGQPQTTDPRTTTAKAHIAVPGGGNPYGAKGGATGAVNPDRVPEGSPGGNPIPSK
jgi:outer membrane protein assembly factor BamB